MELAQYELSNAGIFVNGFVEIIGVDGGLHPASEDAWIDSTADLVDVNGVRGWCIGFDITLQKFIVTTFDGRSFAVDSQNLIEWVSPSAEEGGVDLVTLMSQEEFHAGLLHCLKTKGYCVVQSFDTDAFRRQASNEVKLLRQGYKRLSAEEAEIMLGSQSVTKALDLDPDELLNENASALEAADVHLNDFMMSRVAPVADFLGMGSFACSNSMLRLSMNSSESTALQPKPMTDTSEVSDFLSWLARRHLCVIHCMEVDGGNLLLYPQSDEIDLSSAMIPLGENRIVVFRNECLAYSYQPEGSSLALQAWLLAEPRRFDVRSTARPPRLQLANLHIMSCMERFPINCYGADMVWAMFASGADGQTDWPIERWEKEPYYEEDKNLAIQIGKSYANHGAFASYESLICFNNELFGYSDKEAQFMSVQQKWVLETGYETLHKAGYTKAGLVGQPIMFTIGDSGETWRTIGHELWGSWEAAIEADDCSFTVGRLSYNLGLRGPTLHCDTACSASMVGVNAACKMMKGGTHNDTQHVKSSVCAGILAMQSVIGWIGECAMTMLSPRGRCFSFDKSADGFIRGEGCSALNIQAASGFDDDTLSQRGRLGVLYGTCCNQDGKSASLTAPSGPSQAECLRISLREAELSGSEVTLCELHGTGTALGDPIEVGANKTVFGTKRTNENPHRLITAKSHLGHLEACAGVCGLVKCTLMLMHGCTTPNPHLTALNPHLDTNGYPVLFGNELQDLGNEGNFGGISSFGFGGTNTRGDVWAKQVFGARRHGAKAVLDVEQAREWIKTTLSGHALPEVVEPHLKALW